MAYAIETQDEFLHLSKWAKRRLETWPDLLAMCKEFLAVLERRIPDDCLSRKYKNARVEELKRILSR